MPLRVQFVDLAKRAEPFGRLDNPRAPCLRTRYSRFAREDTGGRDQAGSIRECRAIAATRPLTPSSKWYLCPLTLAGIASFNDKRSSIDLAKAPREGHA
jgi:hypothetical protein